MAKELNHDPIEAADTVGDLTTLEPRPAPLEMPRQVLERRRSRPSPLALFSRLLVRGT